MRGETMESRKRAVERDQFETRDGISLTVAHFHPPGDERGIILIPPLIGGSFIFFGRQFTFLVRNGFRVVSFNYRGHGQSGGAFDLNSSFGDALELAESLKSRAPHLPLFAVGTCSGSMPIFHILTKSPGLLAGVVFINAIYHLQQTATPLEALGLYTKARGWRIPGSAGEMASVVLDSVFPEISKSSSHFGILDYDRVDFPRVTFEYLFKQGPADFVCDPTPALCLYGSHDAMLGLDEHSEEMRYKNEFKRRFADVSFIAFEADHFMSHLKEELSTEVHRFISLLEIEYRM